MPARSSSRSYKASLPFLPPHLRPAVAPVPVEEAAKVNKSKAGFGRIVRDDEGNVIDIIIDQEPEDEVMDEENEKGVVEDEETGERVVEGKTDVVRCKSWNFCLSSLYKYQVASERPHTDQIALEALAATSAPVKRHSSTSEHVWLEQLVSKYGDDTEAMSRDMKLNVWQKTSGEMKRMIKKAGGIAKLQR